MKTNVASTSLQTYDSLGVKAYLQPKEIAVMEVYARDPNGRHTRQQISNLSGMPLHCVCGRVRSLLDKGCIEVLGQTIDPVTRKPQELLGLPAIEQKGLFS